jgi:hypothetical protein
MTTPEEYEASQARYVWKNIRALNELHGELASLYRVRSTDKRRIKVLWSLIHEREANLRSVGFDYEAYALEASR